MARDTELYNRKKQEIKAWFNKLDAERAFGVKKYTIAYCTAATAERFFIKPKTVEVYLYSQTPIPESHHTSCFGSAQQELPL
jgi:hypothetical protein